MLAQEIIRHKRDGHALDRAQQGGAACVVAGKQGAPGQHDVDLLRAGLHDLAGVANGTLDLAAAVGKVGHCGDGG